MFFFIHAIPESWRSHLDDGMPAGGGFDGPPAALRLVVGPVMGLGLHVDVQLIVLRVVGHGPLQGREGRQRDAAEGQPRTLKGGDDVNA